MNIYKRKEHIKNDRTNSDTMTQTSGRWLIRLGLIELVAAMESLTSWTSPNLQKNGASSLLSAKTSHAKIAVMFLPTYIVGRNKKRCQKSVSRQCFATVS